MDAQGELASMRALHQDLVALEDTQLRNIDKLLDEIRAHVQAFRKLLDRPPKSDTSRKQIKSGTIQIEDSEYAVNQEFQEEAIELADALQLDEVQSAKLLLDSQEDAELLGRSSILSAVVAFHERRLFMLESLRILFRSLGSPDCEGQLRHALLDVLGDILEIKDGPARNSSLYTRKCLTAMADIERWIRDLDERYQGTLALGQPVADEFEDIMSIQRSSLGQQHESLAAIVTFLVKGSYTTVDDFLKLLEYLPTIERWSQATVHYVPVMAAFTSHYGSSDHGGSLREARMLHKRIMDAREASSWALHDLQAAMITWWLAEYSGWYLEQQLGSPIQGADLESEARGRSEAFFHALKDGAFHCTLSICSQAYTDDSYDPARMGMTQYLLQDTHELSVELAGKNPLFRDLLLEQLEPFVDSFISNMPDTLRQFQSSEDDQRKRILGAAPSAARSTIFEQDLHLERFLAIIAYTFDKRTEAAEMFWADPDSNLYGFLQWASKRQSTPRVGAFCEMLRAISWGEECATAAHHFLLDDSTTTTRIRRSSSLSWSQLLSELTLYASKVRDNPTSGRPPIRYGGKPNAGDIGEPESPLMLECYLRLMAHICTESSIARSWLTTHETFNVVSVLITLADMTVPPRLQGCALATIRAILTKKAPELSAGVWNAVDQWASNPTPSVLATSRSGKPSTPRMCMEEITFETLSKTYDQANEFVSLLQVLVSPSMGDIGLHDALPFPEQLGTSYRMAGIEPYVDFVFGKVLVSTVPLLEDALQSRSLTNSILNFAATCLSTFNENLVILANKSAVSVDTAIEASSLSAYARLHPFSRVMEWMFNDRVLAALFASARQDIDEVASASPNSPLILMLLRAIEVMNRVMDLQSTYFEIVRPIVKLQSNGHRPAILNPTLASFEDSVVSYSTLIVDLALYSGLGNQELAMNSLRLLEKLACSRRLNAFSAAASRQQPSGNRLVAALEQNGDLERVRTSFILAMQYDDRELELGPTAPGYTIKTVMLDFLSHCLTSLSDRPNLAHAILGFACTGSTLSIEPDGAFAKRTSLFHSIIRLSAEYPEGSDGGIEAWSSSIRYKATQILSVLRSFPLTHVLTMIELRAVDFLFAMFLRQAPFTPETVLDGLSILDERFIYANSAVVAKHYFYQRSFLLEYASSELRLVAAEGSPTLKARILSTIFGSTAMPDGAQLPNVSIFDLLDFLSFDFPHPILSPLTKIFTDVDFTNVLDLENDHGAEASQLQMVEQLLALRLNEYRKNTYLEDPQEQEKALLDAEGFLAFVRARKHIRALEAVRLGILQAWSNLLTLAVGHCDLDQGGRASLILQALQAVTPKLERYATDNAPEAIVLAKLVQALLFQVDFRSSVSSDRARGGGMVDDRLFHVFRTAVRAINVADGDVNLREVLYSICFRYLTGIAESDNTTPRQYNVTQTIKTSGKKFIDVICDDAYGGSGTCRASAVLFLDALAATAKAEKSDYVIESLTRTNFIIVLVETIRDIPKELKDAEAQDVPLLLSYYSAKLALLLTISQTRPGATQVMNADLFPAVRDSGLFAADPDLAFNSPTALTKYYTLLLAVVRVIAAVVLARGPQNHQTIDTVKAFLHEHRALVVAVFKRHARIGLAGESVNGGGAEGKGMERDVEELVELFVVLMTATGFLEDEDKKEVKRSRRLVFS
ncbi:MAG: hypothetical protein LQ352_001191 [Teloschistes flavicans]|nr:MAG: hypothetical protein LQ352_001191 [Teloschistes flavicans]